MINSKSFSICLQAAKYSHKNTFLLTVKRMLIAAQRWTNPAGNPLTRNHFNMKLVIML